jgi:hypothetical protein
MKNAIVLALLLMRMAAEEIVKEEAGNQPQICADGRRSNNGNVTKKGAVHYRIAPE